MYSASHVIGFRLTHETRFQNALDEVASTICQALRAGDRVLQHAEDVREHGGGAGQETAKRRQGLIFIQGPLSIDCLLIAYIYTSASSSSTPLCSNTSAVSTDCLLIVYLYRFSST